VRFETLAKLCEVLDCKPGDLLDFGAPASAAVSAPGDAAI